MGFRDPLDSKNWTYEEMRDLLSRSPLCLMEESLQFSARREVKRRWDAAVVTLRERQAQYYSAQEYAVISDRHGDMGGNWACQGAYRLREEALGELGQWQYLGSLFPPVGECPLCDKFTPGYFQSQWGTSGMTETRKCRCNES